MDLKRLNKFIHIIPDSPGVYKFKSGKKILYVGKASSLRDRVRSYFGKDLMGARGPLIVKMAEESKSVSFEKTDSVLEALILEAYLIKKHKPIYNSKEKDDKSYNYVVITKEDFPRVLLVRGKELLLKKNEEYGIRNEDLEKKFDSIRHSSFTIRSSFGPFPHGSQLKEALKIVRKIFPFRDRCIPFESQLKAKSSKPKASPKPCFNRQIGLCPGVCTGETDKKEYGKQIKNIELFFQGRKDKILKNLEKEMRVLAKQKEFEKAGKVKSNIFAIEHIRDVSLLKLKAKSSQLEASYRIEAYDIAHTGGKETVGVMVVMEDGELNKSEYRKFKIRGDGKDKIDDTKNLKEVLTRRLGHLEWSLPNIIVVDGGVAQMNVARETLKERNFNIEIVSVVKDDKHKPREILGKRGKVNKFSKEILLINNEAHRFAISFHKKRRGDQFLTKFKK